MKNKRDFAIGIALVVFGIAIILADYINGYACPCPGQIVGQPNTCYCQPSLQYYYPIIFGVAISILGLIVLIRAIFIQMPQRLEMKS